MSDILPTDTERKTIHDNRDADVRTLAMRLRESPDLRPIYVLRQISGYQAMRRKMPLWADTEGMVYPVHLSIEQCSSADTAIYKRSIIERLCADARESYADLTAGFGVDFYVMSRGFRHAYYIERNAELCQIAAHNMEVLGADNAEIMNGDGVEFVSGADISNLDVVYMDPARRDSHGGKTVHIEDCEPNVLDFQQHFSKARLVMIKLSPMLDIQECRLRIRHLTEIHVVASSGECKELILVIRPGENISEPTIYAACGESVLSFTKSAENAITASSAPEIKDGMYLYEPNAAIMKAGCYKTVAERFDVKPVHQNSHLYVSDTLRADFPGRRFQIQRIGAVKDFRNLKKANLSVRNFPMKADDLRKKMKLQDGGDIYLFATTINGEKKVILDCRKA